MTKFSSMIWLYATVSIFEVSYKNISVNHAWRPVYFLMMSTKSSNEYSIHMIDIFFIGLCVGVY